MRRPLYLLIMALLAANGCGGGGGSTGTGNPSGQVTTGGDPGQTTSQVRLVTVDDTNWFFSPYNWFRNGATYAETMQPGAYFKIGFTGTRIALQVGPSDILQQLASSPTEIRWQIDANPPQNTILKPADRSIPLNTTPLAAGQHLLSVWYVAGSVNKFTLPVQGLLIYNGAVTSLPPLRPRRILFFGDSITEGILTEGRNLQVVQTNDSTHAYPFSCAAALNAECGVFGVAGQGWTLSPSPLDTLKALSLVHSGSSTTGPDDVAVMEGANDRFANADPGKVAAAVQAWLTAARAMFPGSRLYMIVEFGGFERAAVTIGFQAYQGASHDAKAFLIDLGPAAQQGLTEFTAGGTLQSFDGVHPNAATSAALGAQLATAMQAATP